MSNVRIVPRNFHDEATLATQFAPVDGYSIENTKNTKRGRVWRTTDGSDQFVSGTYADGLSRTASFFGFFRHQCHGGQVRLRLYSDANWTTQVYDSGAVNIINVAPTDGLDWGVNPYGTGSIDPLLTRTPYWLWFTPTAHLSYRYSFSSNVSTYHAGYSSPMTSSYWQVCRFFLGKYFELGYNPLYGVTLGFTDLTKSNRSMGGSLISNVGASWKNLVMDLARIPESERAGWLDIMEYAGTGRDMVASLFPGEATRRERDNTVNCKMTALDPLDRWHLLYLKKRLSFQGV